MRRPPNQLNKKITILKRVYPPCKEGLPMHRSSSSPDKTLTLTLPSNPLTLYPFSPSTYRHTHPRPSPPITHSQKKCPQPIHQRKPHRHPSTRKNSLKIKPPHATNALFQFTCECSAISLVPKLSEP